MAKFFKITCLMVMASFALAACGSDTLGDRYVSFAKCLTEKKTVMYGAYWCSHCADQKVMFGKTAFREITYVECDARGENAKPELCREKNITGTPTWEFADGSRIEGAVPLEELAEKTKCPLPAEQK